MKFKKIILTIAMCLTCGATYADDWMFFSSHGVVVFLIETSSVTCDKGICEYWVGALYDHHLKDSRTRFDLSQHKINCTKRKFDITSVYTYSDEGEMELGYKYSNDTHWQDIPHVSPISEIYDYVCDGIQPPGKPYVIKELTKGKVKRMVEAVRLLHLPR